MDFQPGMLSGHLPEPIESRAWILQEQIMSHRILSYGTKVTYWTCKAGNESDSTDLRSPFGSSLPHTLGIASKNTIGDLTLTWVNIIENYTKRSLSLRKDRVYAISAVAHEFNKLTNSRYLAGMWESMFPVTLLWRLAPDAQLQPRSRDYPAPTWSWMSVHGSVIFPDDVVRGCLHFEPVIGIMESQMNLVFESAKYGGTRDSYLKIRGRLL
ncbi:MAG: hypothetical protein M1820_007487 [Bogoriella megaspora]|nr:MAG: hypothetical protein M1820_007487 [Bogoriella megaspora]